MIKFGEKCQIIAVPSAAPDTNIFELIDVKRQSTGLLGWAFWRFSSFPYFHT